MCVCVCTSVGGWWNWEESMQYKNVVCVVCCVCCIVLCVLHVCCVCCLCGVCGVCGVFVVGFVCVLSMFCVL